MDEKVWDEARIEAEDLANYDQPLDIIGTDIDHRLVKIAEENAFEAGLGDVVNFKQMRVKDFTDTERIWCHRRESAIWRTLGEKEPCNRCIVKWDRPLPSLIHGPFIC